MVSTHTHTSDQIVSDQKELKISLEAHDRFQEALSTLCENGFDPEETLQVMHLFPDGGCDFLRILVGTHTVVTLDLPWGTAEPVDFLDKLSVEQYRRNLKDRAARDSLSAAIHVAQLKDTDTEN